MDPAFHTACKIRVIKKWLQVPYTLKVPKRVDLKCSYREKEVAIMLQDGGVSSCLVVSVLHYVSVSSHLKFILCYMSVIHFFMFIYVEREIENAGRGGAERESQAGSVLSEQSPMWSSNS